MKRIKKTKLYYTYDKDGDVLYFSQGKPSATSLSQEAGDNVILRLDPKNKKIKGFTILNFSKRVPKNMSPIELPISANMVPA